MVFEETILPIDRIDRTDKFFQISINDDIELLAESIGRIGFLALPILRKTDNKRRYQIISGFRRISAACRLGKSSIPARIVSLETTAAESVEIAISDNSLQRNLNLMEQAKAIALLFLICPDTDQVSRKARRLNLPDHPSVLKKLLRVSDMPEHLIEAIRRETVCLTVALELESVEIPVSREYVKLFHQLKPGLNRQKEILSLVSEIGQRENCSPLAVLADDRIAAILDAPDLDAPAKRSHFIRELKQWRYPTVSRIEKRVASAIKDLNLGKGIHIQPPRNFEATRFSVILDFSEPAVLQDRMSKLYLAIKNGGLQKIFPG